MSARTSSSCAGVDRRHPVAALADEVLALAGADERVQPGAVADVDVADDAELLEVLEAR